MAVKYTILAHFRIFFVDKFERPFQMGKTMDYSWMKNLPYLPEIQPMPSQMLAFMSSQMQPPLSTRPLAM